MLTHLSLSVCLFPSPALFFSCILPLFAGQETLRASQQHPTLYNIPLRPHLSLSSNSTVGGVFTPSCSCWGEICLSFSWLLFICPIHVIFSHLFLSFCPSPSLLPSISLSPSASFHLFAPRPLSSSLFPTSFLSSPLRLLASPSSSPFRSSFLCLPNVVLIMERVRVQPDSIN